MVWTLTNFWIQTVAGVIGAIFAATAAEAYRFGFIRQVLVGAVGGALSGYFLQSVVATVVNGDGGLNEIRPVDNIAFQVMGGLAAGGCLTLVVGVVVHSIREHRAS